MNTISLIDEFVAEYTELKRFAASLGHDQNDILDLLQDLAETLLVKGGELQDIRTPIAYFKTCLRHMKYNKMAKNKKEIIVDPDVIDTFKTEPQKDFDLSCLEIIDWLNKQLASSPPELREAFIKYHVDGHPLEQVAQDLNIAPNTLSQTFSRMRKRLKKVSSVLYSALMMMFTLNQADMR